MLGELRAPFSMLIGGCWRHRWAAIAVVLIACLYFKWTASEELGQPSGDGPSYLMMAQYYSPYIATKDPAYSLYASVSRFPPLYPLALAELGAADDLKSAHRVTSFIFLLACVALYLWLCGEGLSLASSSLLMVLFASLPGSWLLGLSIQSEYLYLLFSLLALRLMSLHAKTQKVEMLYSAALAIAAAVLTRSVGISLYLPLLSLLTRARNRSAFVALALAIAPVVLWQSTHHSQLSYASALSKIYGAKGFAYVGVQALSELSALREGWRDNLSHGLMFTPLADGLGVLCVLCFLWRLRRIPVDGLYIAATLLILLIWPFPEEAGRFLWVLMPMLLAQPLLVARELTSAVLDQVLPLGMAGCLSVMALPMISTAASRYQSAIENQAARARGFLSWYGEDFEQSQQIVRIQMALLGALHRIPAQVPLSDCVLAPRPDLVSYYGKRRGVFPPLNSVPDPEFQREAEGTGCHYAFGYSSTDGRYPGPFHPLPRLQAQSRIIDLAELPSSSAGQRLTAGALVKLDFGSH